MDVPKLMTILRVIPHAKRGKMDGIKIPHGSLSRLKKGTNDLSQYGARSDLLTCGDEHFIGLLFDTICNQARSLAKGIWAPHQRVTDFALVIVGGSTDACVAVGVGGKSMVKLNGGSITVSIPALEDELVERQIVNSEEGEMMVYATLAAIVRLGFTHMNWDEGLDCIFAGISTDDELKASCYRESMKKGRTIMFIEYDLCELAKERQSRLSGDNLMRELTTRYYGNLLPDAPMQFTHIFEPIDVIKDTLKNGGICPRAKVLQYLLPEKTEIAGIDPGVSGHDESLIQELLKDMDEELDDPDSDDEDSDEETSTASSISVDEGEVVEDEWEDGV